MKTGCLISLTLYVALLIAYRQWFAESLDPPAVWIVAAIVGLVSTCALGALYNSYQAARDAAAVRHAAHALPLRDGWAAAVGTIHPLEAPLVAPLSGSSCVLYEYAIARMAEVSEGNRTVEKPINDFVGLAMTPCVIRSEAGSVKLFGFPDLDRVPERDLDSRQLLPRVRQYVKDTRWLDSTGIKVVYGAGTMFKALVGADESIRCDWQIGKSKHLRWLEPELDEEGVPVVLSDDDAPHLTEKIVTPGESVVAIGRFDAERGGLVSTATATGAPIRLHMRDADSVAAELNRSKWSRLFGGLITLAFIHGFLPDIISFLADRANPPEQRQQDFRSAVLNDRIDDVAALLDRRVSADTPINSERKTGLMVTRNPQMARLLLERGANVNATDDDGSTALMFAAANNNVDMLRVLIDAGADLNVKNTRYHSTALERAIGAEHEEAVELLRAAGAKDDRITAVNGAAIGTDHPAFATCREYLRAIYAEDVPRLKSLSTRDRPANFSRVDWASWRHSRPSNPQLVDGFIRGDDATVVVDGVGDGGYSTTWEFQLRREENEWRILRERWVVKGLR
jgi:hypothetical protein